MSEETYSEKLARYYQSLRYEQIPVQVIAAAKLHILDSSDVCSPDRA